MSGPLLPRWTGPHGPVGLARRLAHKGPRLTAQTLVRKLADRLDVAELDFPLLDGDVYDSVRATARTASERAALAAGSRVAWLVVPPGVGSGGHTTLFRMIQAAERAGIVNTLLLYDRYRGDMRLHEERIRAGWPWLTCEIAAVPQQLQGFDAYVASSWQTAHVLGARAEGAPGSRHYFVQDFEPYFHPRGALYSLAEDSYRFGFHMIALGPMVGTAIGAATGTSPSVVPFGADTVVYRLLPERPPREGVAFFAKRGNDRRGFRIADLALREFQSRHPQVPIHVYGDEVREQGRNVVNHGYLSPDDLNRLYNSVVAGLVLSFTNVSLIPAELAAAGAIPVLNEHTDARHTFDNPEAVWAAATPTAIADALERTVMNPDGAVHERAAAWRTPSWDDTSAELVGLLMSPDRTAPVG
ncbi:glycosyltransferase family 1 protein [Microbacterium sp. Sa4CUA7]|uniref:Glycosyltransferase family 1 protein n=1 Tax=Microbacterium pullorum TaxID=2762236 RepID=A0ABR8S4Y5_9MICO|nr:glycosyltransferase family 1 protein [Microbacterium pullorum]MBD7958551.1 glycosyltransferase family 1 protein [Microbacterium pullorum]